jgi:hypothetical protein
MSETISIDEIQKIQKYNDMVANRKVYQKKYYEKIKATNSYKERTKQYRDNNPDKLRQYSAKSYNKYYHEGRGKEKKKDYYAKNKEQNQAKNSYSYYKRRDRLDDFKNKFPDRHQLLVDVGYLS